MSERGQKRRRLREQLRLREALLLDLGALVYELHRQGKRAPELLQQKAAELTVVDEEVRGLQAELDGIIPLATAPETAEGDALDEDPFEDDGPEDEEPEDAGPEDAGPNEDPLEEDEDDEEPYHGDFGEDETEDQPALAEHEEPHA
ncbi:MAG: hypothetical protein QOE60_441 [Thermoleophilaceae bacterium]|nr:hypothetical protein [Thermoleophilaceae bacterium]